MKSIYFLCLIKSSKRNDVRMDHQRIGKGIIKSIYKDMTETKLNL